MNNSNKLLSDIVAFRTYAKHLNHLSRRETLEETINRNMTMYLDKFPKLSRDIIKAFQYIHERKLMPSMRSMQFAGNAIEANNIRLYNCSFTHINNVRSFGEVLFLLLSGAGVGFSVQKHHVNQLPTVKLPTEEGRFIIQDSIQGWSQAIQSLVESYFYRNVKPVFDFSVIRPKGSYLITTGAKAPGPEPLKHMLKKIEDLLKNAIGRQLRPIEVHDMICMTADCVLSGGVRRAATISLFDRDDNEMINCKSGEWWEKYPYRARANNSVILPRKEVTREEFYHIFEKCRNSGSGEPGFSWTDDVDLGINPCAEITLETNQFCNLTTVSQTDIKDKRDFMERLYTASLIATLQASFTDFPFLRDTWKLTTERDALIGVSFTGIADAENTIPDEWLNEGARSIVEVNQKYAKRIGINPAKRCTTVKPEGTSSCILGSSSGIHARHSEYYIRRIRMSKSDPLVNYLMSEIDVLIEDDLFDSAGVVVSIPQQSPPNAITRHSESAVDLFKRVIKYNQNWIAPGHIEGANKNNVSCTISIKEEEWDEIKELMWDNRDSYNGISLLPFDGGTYKQAPFEEIDKTKYDEMVEEVNGIDLTKIIENQDNTSRTETISCAGGSCELNL